MNPGSRPWHRHYPAGIPTSPAFTDTWLPQQLAEAAARYPRRTALIFQNAHLSYRKLLEQVERLGTAFEDLGVTPGDRVAIQLPNIPQCVIAFYAALRIGAVPSMTNPLYVPREIEHQWNDCGARVAVVADYLYESKIRGIRDRLPIRDYIIASIPEYLPFPMNLLAPFKLRRAQPPLAAKVARGPGVHFLRRLITHTSSRPTGAVLRGDAPAVLLYTGGTTGVSKGATLTHRNLSCNVQQIRAWFKTAIDGEEVQLAALPYFHSYGMTVAMTFPISIGATIVLIPNPRDIGNILRAIETHRVTLAPQVPAMYTTVTQFRGVDRMDLKSIKLCKSGSAPLSVDVLKRYEALTGARIVEGYGLTETSPVTHCNPVEGMCKVGSIGMPLPGTDARIVDIETGTTDVAPGTEGELILKGPQVMAGYWQKPEETAGVLRDGWLHTGDLAVMDEDGYFRIVGRKKEMIIVRGFKVFPDEVDRVFMAHEAVLEAATIGVPDEKRGETVKSFVVLKPGQSATVDDLKKHASALLAPYKVPKEIEFRSALPRSSVLKILRRELRDEELQRREAGSGKREAGRVKLDTLDQVSRAVVKCERCKRLRDYCRLVASVRKREFRDWEYWGKPIPSFGDPRARLLIVGLAPAAHGANRTGRTFTGDSSGNWLYEALHRFGFANQPESTSRNDGLRLTDCYIAASARCAPPDNKPLPQEFDNCQSYLEAEYGLLKRVQVILVLGKLAHDRFLKASRAGGKPVFGHGAETALSDGRVLLASYHPSRQNTNTGRLTRPMWHGIFRRARALIRP